MLIKDIVFVYRMKSEAELRWHGRCHNHDLYEYEVHYFLQGRGSFLNGGSRYAIEGGSLFLTRPEVLHSITAEDLNAPVTYYAVLFRLEHEEEARELMNSYLSDGKVYRIGTNYRFFFEELKEKSMSDHILLKKSAEHQFLSFLYQLSDGLARFHYGSESNVHIEKALHILQKSVLHQLTLRELADRLQLSEAYLVRLFHRKMKLTPMKYFRKLKIEAAASMLINTQLPIYQISRRLSFYSEFHFSKVFKQVTGCSPTEYRNRYYQIIG